MVTDQRVFLCFTRGKIFRTTLKINEISCYLKKESAAGAKILDKKCINLQKTLVLYDNFAKFLKCLPLVLQILATGGKIFPPNLKLSPPEVKKHAAMKPPVVTPRLSGHRLLIMCDSLGASITRFTVAHDTGFVVFQQQCFSYVKTMD